MNEYRIGDVVTRKSYGGDTLFKIANTYTKEDGSRVHVLRGLLYRIEADAEEGDLEVQDSRRAYADVQRSLGDIGIGLRSLPPLFYKRIWIRTGRPGLILHIDSSAEYLDMCVKYYRKSNLRAIGKVFPESEQPGHIRPLLESTKADVIVVTGHDGIKKNAGNLDSVDSYRNSRYYIASTREARKYQPDFNKLCIFAGACQSYYEGIMGAGANFASSPGRVFIHALDPGKVGERVALTESSSYVTAAQLAEITQSGAKGIGGINTKGHYIR